MTEGTISVNGVCNVTRDGKHVIAHDKEGKLMCIWCKQYVKEGVEVETKQFGSDGLPESFEIKKVGDSR